MAAPTAANVTVGSTDFTGGVFAAVIGTTFDTGNLGLLGDSGVQFSNNQGTQDIKAWHNNVIVRTLVTETKVTFTFEMIELSAAALAEYFDASTGATAFKLSGATKPKKSYIVYALDGTRIVRIVVPSGQVTQRGDFSLVGTDIIRMPVTLTAYPDADGYAAYGYIGTLV